MTTTAQPLTPRKSRPTGFNDHLFRQFLLPSAAAALLGYSTKHIIRLARDGHLRGFNLALKNERSDASIEEHDLRTMVRIQRRSVEILRRPELFPSVHPGQLDLADDLPHRRSTFTVREVWNTLGCCDNHVRRLLENGMLAGPALSPVSERRHVNRESLLSFLRARELTAP